MSVRREQLRLSKAFRHLVLLSLGAAAGAEACSSSSSGNGPGLDGGLDSPSGSDGGGSGSGSGGDATMGHPDAADDGHVTQEGSSDGGVEARSCARGVPYYTDASYVVAPDAGDGAPPCALGLAPAYVFIDYPCGIEASTGTGIESCYYSTFACEGQQGKPLCPLDAGAPIDCLVPQGAFGQPGDPTTGCADGAPPPQPGQALTLACGLCPGVGRRPAGLRRPRRRAATAPLGELFAQVSHLEAASVFAFDRLHDELRAHGAPEPLARAAQRSARDEVRHARVTARLARRFGGATPPVVHVRRARGARDLGHVALENAVEGCVRETFGAMVATWQAAHAEDEAVRKSMARIAADETRHAALAWAVAEWAEGRLDARARARIHRARARVARELAADATFALPAAVRRSAGLPSAREAQALVTALSGMWS